MTERNSDLQLYKLRIKARDRIRDCLQRTTEDLLFLEMKKRQRKYLPSVKMKLTADHVSNIQHNIESKDPKAMARGLSDLNDVFERIEKRINPIKKRRF